MNRKDYLRSLIAIDRVYILSAYQIFKFIAEHTSFDDLDMEDWFSEWLENQKSISEQSYFDHDIDKLITRALRDERGVYKTQYE